MNFLTLFIFFIKIISKLLKNDLLINFLKTLVNLTHLLITDRRARLDIVPKWPGLVVSRPLLQRPKMGS